MEDDRETSRRRGKDVGEDMETARRQERKREQEMLRFPLDVRCVSVPGMLACCPLSLRACWTEAERERSRLC